MLDRQSFEWVRIWAYKQRCFSRRPVDKRVRKLLSKTNIHRAWLQGWTGSFLVSVLERSCDDENEI